MTYGSEGVRGPGTVRPTGYDLVEGDARVGAAVKVAGLVRMLAAERPRVRSVVVGHGRDAASLAAAFVAAWDGDVLSVVDWPERAASWLRQARRFTAQRPDAWVVAGAPAGWAGMAGRLRLSTSWDPTRTFGFAATAQAIALAAPGTMEGMRGTHPDGSTWRLGRTLIHRETP